MDNPENYLDGKKYAWGWNWGAFFLNWIWCFSNGLWFFGILTLLPFVIFAGKSITNPYSTGFYYDHPLWIAAASIVCMPFKNPVMVVFLALRGNKFAIDRRKFASKEDFTAYARSWGSSGVLLFLISALIYGIMMPSMVIPERKMAFFKCGDGLGRVSKGLRDYIAEKKSLDGIGPKAEEACNYIFSGYDKPGECRGRVSKMVEKACSSYNVEIVSSTEYNVIGKSKGANHCALCFTESGYYPEAAGLCSANEKEDCYSARQSSKKRAF